MLKVIIIEDDRKIAKILERIIKKNFGCEVFEASNGLEGLSVINEEKPDLVFLDLNMPVMDGFETLDAIRADPEFDKLPVVILSADNEKETVSKLMSKGIVEYILKPLDFNTTTDRIARILATHVKDTNANQIEINNSAGISSKPKLLVIDAEEIFIKLFYETFKEKYKVISASTGMEGMEVFLKELPSTVIICPGLKLLNENLFVKKIKLLNLEPQPKIYLSLAEQDKEPEDIGQFDGIFRKSQTPESLTKELEKIIAVAKEN